MLPKTCNTCLYYDPRREICTRPCRNHQSVYDTYRVMLMIGQWAECPAWQKHRCKNDTGTLELREHNGKKYYYCYSCHFDYPIPEEDK